MLPTRVANQFKNLVTRLLTHPWTMALKAPVRDVSWEIRGWSIRNPAQSRTPRSMLFVCKGNICRSPFAAALTNRLLERAGETSIRSLSAGFAASPETRSPAAAIEVSQAFDVALENHRPVVLTAQMVEDVDLVVAMEVSHLTLLKRRFPEHKGKFVLLPLFVPRPERGRGYRSYNIADPYGRPREVFETCYARIDMAVRALVADLRGGQQRDTRKQVATSRTATGDEEGS